MIISSAARSVTGAAAAAAIIPAAGALGVVFLSVAVGIGIDWIDKKLRISETVIKATKALGDDIKRIYQYLEAEDGVELLKTDIRQSNIYQELNKASKMQPQHLVPALLGIPLRY